MTDTPPVVALTDPSTLAHDPLAEFWLGTRLEAVEVPQRVTAIRDALRGRGVQVVEVAAGASEGLDDLLALVHDAALLDFLRTAAEVWQAHGYPEQGAERVVPYVFPTPGFLEGSGRQAGRVPTAPHALTGIYAYDTMTMLGPGTWTAARAAAGLAAEAARRARPGRPVYALCRPPGHHVTRAAYGGSCYLNNAAVAVESFRRSGVGKVAVIDVDAHHGNGTQAIFYDRGEVWYGSMHVDVGAGWFPHFVGFADERGDGAGAGCTRNLPLPPGSGDEAFVAAVGRLVAEAGEFGAEAVVVSLGVDAAIDDPESPLQVGRDGYAAAGALLAGPARAVPMAVVQEGGYHLPTLGDLVATVLAELAAPPGPPVTEGAGP